jgi:colanic acid biosynthesis glycosyl transferase WcaI
MVGFAALHLTMAVTALRHCRHTDVAIVVSPPLTFAAIAQLLRVTSGTRVIYNAQELWPDVPRDLGVIRNRWILAALGMTERWIYRSSAAVTAIGDHFAREIRRRGGTDTDVHTIPNFVDTAWISPRPKRNALAEEWGVADRPVLLYAGNLGLTQDFDLLLDTATKLPEVELVIVGAGARQADLERELERRDLPNVRLEPYQPEERVADLYGLADVVAVPLAAGHDRTTTPSKIFAAMAASRPIVVCAAVDTDLAQQVTSARAGTVVPPGDLRAFVAAVRSFVSGPSLDFDAGAALKEAESRSPRRVTAAYSALIDELVP